MSLLDAVSDLLDDSAEAEPEPQAKHPHTIPPLSHRPSPEEALTRCGPHLRKRARQDPVLLEEVRDYLAGGARRTIEPAEHREPTDADVTAALELANRYGWDERALAVAFEGDWPGMAAEPHALEALLRDVVPHPGLTGAA